MSLDTLSSLGWRNFFQQQLSLDELESLSPMRVMGVERSELSVAGEQGLERRALDAHWQQLPTLERPTVGDWLLVDAKSHTPTRLLERQSLIKRRAAGERSNEQLIAANIDTLFIVSSCNADFNASRLERYLALAFEAQVTPVIVLTKADGCADPESYEEQAQALHSSCVVLSLNALASTSQALLEPWCSVGQTIALLGSSGVGKSTLVNTLMRTEVAATGGIREADAKGRHTTTNRSLHQLPGGGLILDSPGMRELQLTDVRSGLGALFEDIELLGQNCRFANCGHASEPGCAVQAAINSGQLDARRLNNYYKLLREEAHNNMSIAERHAKSRQFAKQVKQHKKPNRGY